MALSTMQRVVVVAMLALLAVVTVQAAPPSDMSISSSNVDENSVQGTVVGTFSTTDPDAGDTHTYTIVSQDSLNAFQLNGDVLEVGSGGLDHEDKDTISVRMRSSDTGGGAITKTFFITINDVNEAPTNIASSGSSVNEDSSQGALVGSVLTTDVDDGDTHTYTIVSQNPANSFQFDNHILKVGSAGLNHEATPTIDVTVRSTDSGGLTTDKVLTITINDVNEAPTDIAISSTNVDETSAQGTVVGTLSTTDVDDGDTFTYTIFSQSPTNSFQIDNNKLEVGSAGVDHEATGTIDVTIRTEDSGGEMFDKAFTITINDVNEAPTDVALSNSNVDENSAQGTLVGTLSTTDEDDGDTHTYTITHQGPPNPPNQFQISNNQLQVGSAGLNHEATATVDLSIRTTDSSGSLVYSTFQTFTITINDVNDAPTDVAITNSNVDENSAQGTVVGTLSTTDVDDGDTHTYTIVSQSAGNSFQISSNQLEVGSAGLNHEATGTIDVTIRSTDAGGESFDKVLTITINDVNEAPTGVALSNSNVVEGVVQGTVVGTLSTTEVDDSDTHTYTIVSQTPANSFQIGTDQLQVGGAGLNHEATATTDVTIRSTDAGGETFDQVFTITINDVNEAPSGLALSGASIKENSDVGSMVGTLSTTDVDDGDTFTYTVVSQDQPNAFRVVGNELQVGAGGVDHERASTYNVVLRTTDSGGLSYSKSFAVVVEDVEERVVLGLVAAGLGVGLMFTAMWFWRVTYYKPSLEAEVKV